MAAATWPRVVVSKNNVDTGDHNLYILFLRMSWKSDEITNGYFVTAVITE